MLTLLCRCRDARQVLTRRHGGPQIVFGVWILQDTVLGPVDLN
jgi:hypothetical protein